MNTELEQSLKNIPVKMVFRHVGLVVPSKQDKDNWVHDAWEVTLSYEGREYTTKYHTGIGHRKLAKGASTTYKGSNVGYFTRNSTVKLDVVEADKCGLIVVKPPTLSDVVHSLLCDASCATSTFEEWCSDLGYDIDSRKALDTYLQCQTTSLKMRRLLSSKIVDDLMKLEH
jgi:hypothetical protein